MSDQVALTRRWVGSGWPGRAGAAGCWTLDHSGGWRGERTPGQSPAGRAPAAGRAARAPTRDAAWTSRLRHTKEGDNASDKAIRERNDTSTFLLAGPSGESFLLTASRAWTSSVWVLLLSQTVTAVQNRLQWLINLLPRPSRGPFTFHQIPSDFPYLPITWSRSSSTCTTDLIAYKYP